MKKCPHCGRYNGTNNSKCSACNNFLQYKKTQEIIDQKLMVGN